MAQLMDDVLGMATNVEVNAPAPAEKKTRDPLAKFKELSPEDQQIVSDLVDDLVAKIGGDNIKLELLLGVLDKLNALKKTAREVAKTEEKKQKEIAKEKAEARGDKLKKDVAVNDTISYYMATNKIFIKGLKVVKVTEKSARVEVVADTVCIDKNGNEVLAKNIPSLKLGMKSVAFSKITEHNGVKIA